MRLLASNPAVLAERSPVGTLRCATLRTHSKRRHAPSSHCRWLPLRVGLGMALSLTGRSSTSCFRQVSRRRFLADQSRVSFRRVSQLETGRSTDSQEEAVERFSGGVILPSRMCGQADPGEIPQPTGYLLPFFQCLGQPAPRFPFCFFRTAQTFVSGSSPGLACTA